MDKFTYGISKNALCVKYQNNFESSLLITLLVVPISANLMVYHRE